jgi:hypothetical protein
MDPMRKLATLAVDAAVSALGESEDVHELQRSADRSAPRVERNGGARLGGMRGDHRTGGIDQ